MNKVDGGKSVDTALDVLGEVEEGIAHVSQSDYTASERLLQLHQLSSTIAAQVLATSHCAPCGALPVLLPPAISPPASCLHTSLLNPSAGVAAPSTMPRELPPPPPLHLCREAASTAQLGSRLLAIGLPQLTLWLRV